MSAWIVEKEHIDVLIKAGLEGPGDNQGDIRYLNGTLWDDFGWYFDSDQRVLTPATADEVGDMLVRTNVRSVDHRYSFEGRVPYYGEEIAAQLNERTIDLPGATEYWMSPYRYTDPGFRPTVAEIVKTIGCYEYQSCEHAEWEESEAAAFCRDLRAVAVYKLPGYAETPWGWDEQNIAARRVR